MRSNSEKAASMLGLAQRAGKVAGGGLAAEKAVKGGKAYLLILAEDASANTVKKFTNMAAWNKVPLQSFLTKAELGKRIGKEERSVLAVTDGNFAEAIQKHLNEERSV